MDNHTYNLMKACVKKSQALYRYDRYLEDSKDCPECQELWKKIQADDKTHLEMIKGLLVKQMK